MAFIVGAGLSLCGVLMQALTKIHWQIPMSWNFFGASAGAVQRHHSRPVQLYGRLFRDFWCDGAARPSVFL